MKIKSDKKLNKELQEEVSNLRSIMINNTKVNSSRFMAVPSEESPSMFITDTMTGKQIEVPLCGYRHVMIALEELFD